MAKVRVLICKTMSSRDLKRWDPELTNRKPLLTRGEMEYLDEESVQFLNRYAPGSILVKGEPAKAPGPDKTKVEAPDTTKQEDPAPSKQEEVPATAAVVQGAADEVPVEVAVTQDTPAETPAEDTPAESPAEATVEEAVVIEEAKPTTVRKFTPKAKKAE